MSWGQNTHKVFYCFHKTCFFSLANTWGDQILYQSDWGTTPLEPVPLLIPQLPPSLQKTEHTKVFASPIQGQMESWRDGAWLSEPRAFFFFPLHFQYPSLLLKLLSLLLFMVGKNPCCRCTPMSCITACRHHGALCRTTTLPLLHPLLAEAHLLLVPLQASHPDEADSLPHLLFSVWFYLAVYCSRLPYHS